jgi:hypothetical protein
MALVEAGYVGVIRMNDFGQDRAHSVGSSGTVIVAALGVFVKYLK